ncbi:hypothetical protein AB0D33_34480 [Streptomyces sp. NPDC048404]|uniref:hypothetical protein n=1 Tax=unclassified Streptomyces TaxID=2593676 RepID=UPI0034156FE5
MRDVSAEIAELARDVGFGLFLWEHESDSRRWVAGGLRDYLGRALRTGGDDWYQLTSA